MFVRKFVYGRNESSSFERKVPGRQEPRGARVIAREDRDDASESAARQKGRRHQSARQAPRTSCYILKEYSNSDAKRGARSVNEDPRGETSRMGETREERNCMRARLTLDSFARSRYADEGEKERG